MSCETCKKFWSDLEAWTTKPLYSDIDPLDIVLTAVLVTVAVIIVLDINSLLKGKPV